MKKFFLDATMMEHPEPLERAIAIIRQLDTQSYLYMVHRKNPIPLISLAQEHNLGHISRNDGDLWHIVITPNSQIDPSELLEMKE